MHPLIQLGKENPQLVYVTAYVIAVFIVIIFALVKKIREIKAEAKLKIQIMSEAIDELVQDHDEELRFEKKIAATHVIKMRMQRKDFSSKLGGLQRKLRKQNETLSSMNSKLATLEFVEEDANELVDEVVTLREQLKKKDAIIESLQKQLKFHSMGSFDSSVSGQRVLQENTKVNSNL